MSPVSVIYLLNNTECTYELYIISLWHFSWTKRHRKEGWKHLRRLYDHVCEAFVLQIFKEDTASWLAHILIALIVSLHVAKQIEGNYRQCVSYIPSKFRPNGSQWWHVHSILDVPQKGKMKHRKVRRTRWPCESPAFADTFPWKLYI
jgi:hypothetical protein